MQATETPHATNAGSNLSEDSQTGSRAPARTSAWWRTFSRVSTPGVAAVALMLVGAALRMLNLDTRSLWLDEVVSANSAAQPSFLELIGWTQADYDQMPMFNLIVWLMRGLPLNEVTLRMPAAIAGVLCIGAVYLLGKALYNARVGLVAAALMTVMPFAVWYSQEARIYSIFMLLTTLQMLFAYRAATRARLSDWLLFVALTILNLYAHYMALTVAAAAFAFLGVMLVVDIARAWRRRGSPNDEHAPTARYLAKRGAFLVAGGLIAGLSFLPWLPTLQAFLGRPDKGFSRFNDDAPFTLERIGAMLGQFDFTGVTLWLLCVGVIAAAAYAVRGKWRQGALLLCWFAVPLGGLSFKMHGAVLDLVPRYLSFLFPAALVVAAVGVDGVAALVGRALKMLGRSGRSRLIFGRAGVWAAIAAIGLVLAMQLAPALAQSYHTPKDDYRAAARLVTAGPPNSIVITLGCYSGVAAYGLDYYFKALGANAHVMDIGAAMTDRVVQQVQSSGGVVWAAAKSNCNDVHNPSPQLDVTKLAGLDMVRLHTPVGTPVEQANALVTWATSFDPSLRSASDLLGFYSGTQQLGANLLPPLTVADKVGSAGHWSLPSGSKVLADGQALQLSPTGGQLDATAATGPVKEGQRYVLTFEYRNIDFSGNLRILALAQNAQHTASGNPLGDVISSFPNANGYRCLQAPGSADWATGAFSFTLPPGSASLTVVLRASGAGSAAFRSVQLRQVP